jgi:hypothetical protein
VIVGSEQMGFPPNQIEVKLQKKIAWVLTDGFHRAKIVDAGLVNKGKNGKDEWELRLIFEITSLLHPTKTFMAKRSYGVKESDYIIRDLEELLRADVDKVIDVTGEIIADALDLLVGIEVDLEIDHIQGKNYADPYCRVAQIKKAGAFTALIGHAG